LGYTRKNTLNARREEVSGETKIKLYRFLVAVATLFILALPSRADNPPANEQCAKGPVSEIPESMRWMVDEQTGITWYTDKSTTDHLNQDAFYLYAGKKGCDVWLRLRVQYLSEKPTNVTRLQIKADGKAFELADPHFKRDSDGKLTWQWFDERMSADHLIMLFTITASKSAVLRFVGTSRTDERTVGEEEKAALKAVLSTYRALGGQL
jgi:hypothetical protein